MVTKFLADMQEAVVPPVGVMFELIDGGHDQAIELIEEFRPRRSWVCRTKTVQQIAGILVFYTHSGCSLELTPLI